MYRIVGSDGKQYGPITADQVREWIAEGRADGQTQVFVEGQTDWITLGQLPEFAPALAAAVPIKPVPLALPPAVPPSTNPLAVAGFVLGLLSLFGSCCCCYGLPFSIPGLVVSAVALAQLRKDENRGGKGLAVAGLVLCLLGIAIGLVLFALQMSGTDTDWLRKLQHQYGR
jgi:hypothetical protein